MVSVRPLRNSGRGGKGTLWKKEEILEEEGSYGAALMPFLRLAMVIVNMRSGCRTTRVSFTPSQDVSQLQVCGLDDGR